MKMNIDDLENIKESKVGITLEESIKIANIGSKALKSGYMLEYGCSKCYYGKKRIPSDDYPGYVTKDCECVPMVRNINKFMDNCKYIEKGEINEYDFRRFKEDRITIDLLHNFGQSDDWYFFFGTPGVGKTYAAYALLFLAAVEKTIFASSLQIVLEDARPDEHNPSQGLMFRRCMNVDVLLLDDFGREKMSEWAMNKLFSLLDTRVKRGLQTIFTSNFDYNELEALKDTALASRVIGKCKKVKLSGEDLRLK